LAEALSAFGVGVAFTWIAVIMAQVFISAAFYVFAARQAFEAVDDELLAVSRTLGESPWRTFLRITMPLALPGLISGAALSLARALGEFGATIVFAGNLPGSTQTMPLAIYTALQSNFDVAVAISALLLSVAFILLLLVGLINRRQRAFSS
jgi:molybdate transport system permease protein